MASNSMKILMVTSETVPYAKTGGLADVVSALAKQLKKHGHDVRIIMPKYYGITPEGKTKHEAPLSIPLGFGEVWCGVYEEMLPGTEVPVYFLDHEGLYGRDGVYGAYGEGYIDNCKRFTVLSRGAFQLCKMLDWYPDIMHAHDWPTAIVPLYLNSWEKEGYFTKTASVLTIHNLGYQGWFPKDDIHYLQLEWEEFHASGLEFFDDVNFLKSGIANSDIITTVSPTYAKEIQSTEHGNMLETQLKLREGDLYGILNGMDYDHWNPEDDPLIPAHFSHKDLTGKAKNKAELQKRMGLEVAPEKPLIGIVSRLVDQKGFGALCGPGYGSLFSICSEMDCQVVILGTGDNWCENELRTLSHKLPNLNATIAFDNSLAHLIEAGSDFFLMPSAYEPCGLNQMYSLRYGTLPIVRNTGGLADTVENYNQETGEGTGFVFNELTPGSIYDTVGWAVWAWYNQPKHIEKMKKRAMQLRFSWDHSAVEYERIYEAATAKRRRFRGLID